MIAPLQLISGNDEVEIEDWGGSVSINILPWRDVSAGASLDFGDALHLLEWLTEWVAANAPAKPEA